MLKIRNATMEDFDRIKMIYKYAQDFMIASGNPTQWGHAHPEMETVENDIHQGYSKVIYDEAGIHGVFAVLFGEDPTYRIIEQGQWLNDEPYVTIHRIAGDGKVHGIFQCAADYCKELSENVRIDTHHDNKIMQNLIEKNAFQKCGIIYVRDHSERIAYHWAKVDGV